MDLRHLRYFVAVAAERHFTRAAEGLGIRQPPLSLQIQQLEQELGTPPFHRLPCSVELTEAGALLLDEGRQILEHVERTKTNVQNRARGQTGRIGVGFAGATHFHPRGHIRRSAAKPRPRHRQAPRSAMKRPGIVGVDGPTASDVPG